MQNEYVYIYILHINTYIKKYIYISIYLLKFWTCKFIYISNHINTFNKYIYIYTYKYVSMYICINVYIYIHIYFSIFFTYIYSIKICKYLSKYLFDTTYRYILSLHYRRRNPTLATTLMTTSGGGNWAYDKFQSKFLYSGCSLALKLNLFPLILLAPVPPFPAKQTHTVLVCQVDWWQGWWSVSGPVGLHRHWPAVLAVLLCRYSLC